MPGRAALLTPVKLDVVSADPFPRVSSEPPLLDPRGLADGGEVIVRLATIRRTGASVVLWWRMATNGFRLSGITIDCLDPYPLAQFWAGLLGGDPRASLPGWYELGERGGPRVNFQPVPEPKNAKTRIHLDLTVEDIDRAVEAVVQAGGRATGERHDYAEGIVVVMADPEENEFCLVKYFT